MPLGNFTTASKKIKYSYILAHNKNKYTTQFATSRVKKARSLLVYREALGFRCPFVLASLGQEGSRPLNLVYQYYIIP